MAKKQPQVQRIALFTDFGESGPYTGQMEAVLHAAGVRVPVIRLMSDAPRCNPRAAAYLLAAIARFVPENTLFLAIVDPGVGGKRLPLVVQADAHWYVGPDNGLFSQVVKQANRAHADIIDWRPEVISSSFHGRDLFAPVAADCIAGCTLRRHAAMPDNLTGVDWPGNLGEVIYIDHYGNCVTGIDADSVNPQTILISGDHEIVFAETFSAVSVGDCFWYRNSIGLVEIAVNLGGADRLLDLAIGSRIERR